MEQARALNAPGAGSGPVTRARQPWNGLATRAAAVLSRNWQGRYTLPAAGGPAHQWSWNSAFVTIGLARTAQHRAQVELAGVLGAQWPDGRLPQIVFDPDTPADSFFPGPRFWSPGCPSALRAPTSGLVAPPLHARAAWTLYRTAPDREAAAAFLRRVYAPLCAWHTYLRTRRDLDGGGLAAIVHPWETEQNGAVDGAGLLGPTAPGPDPMLALATQYRDRGCTEPRAPGQHTFAVEDPLFNGVLAWSEEALGRIAGVIGADRRRHADAARQIGVALVERLFDPAAGTFHPRDLRTSRPVPGCATAGAAALVSPDLPAAVVARTGAAVAGIRASAPGWPAAPTATWLVVQGLRRHGDHGGADALAAGLLSAVAAGGCRQRFETDTGAGGGAEDVSRTAAVVLDLLGQEY